MDQYSVSELHSPPHANREMISKSEDPIQSVDINAVKNCNEYRKFLFPVELLFLLYSFNHIFQTTYYQQYYFQRLAHEKLTSVDVHNLTGVCLDQELIVNYTNDKSFLHLQERVNDLNMYTNLIAVTCSSLSSIFLGPLSDLVGRKPIFFYVIIGSACSFVLQSLVVYFEWNIHYFFLVLFIYGISGGIALTCGLSFAYITDTTPKRWLGMRMGILEAAIAIGRGTSSLGSNNWIHNNGCSFFPPSLLIIGTACIAILYLLFMPESLTHKARDSSANTQGFSKFINGLKIFFYPKYIGISNWWRVWAATGIICIACFSAVGGVEIQNFFLFNKPLQWSYEHIGYYNAARSGLMGLVLICLLPAFVAIGFSSAFIALIGSVCAITANVIIANVKTNWEMYIAGALQSMQQLGFPTMRTILASLVQPNDHGAVFTISSSFQMVASIISTIVFNKIYKPETIISGHKINAGIAFWVMASMWAISIPLILLLLFCKQKKRSIDAEEERTLLNDDSNSSYGSKNKIL